MRSIESKSRIHTGETPVPPDAMSEKKMSKPAPLRILTAVPICDGHDSAINTINLEFVRAGMEVIYLGYHRPARDIVRAAIQEDVAAVGISSYNGGHVEFFAEVVVQLKRQGAGHIKVFGGGGGTISTVDMKLMEQRGVDKIFPAGTPLDSMVQFTLARYSKVKQPVKAKARSDLALSIQLSRGMRSSKSSTARSDLAPPVIGVAGPGGAGKTTLIDELILRFLKQDRKAKIAILSHDPSIVHNGALLGDRATMIHSQNDRVFMRSLATHGQAGGLSPETEAALRTIRSMPFDLIIVETVGIGQEAIPFKKALVSKTLFVMSPDYGSKLQLQKIAMLDVADVIVVNKSDQAGGARASAEIESRIRKNRSEQQVVATCAKRHRDTGVDRLFEMLMTSDSSTSQRKSKKKSKV